MSSPAAAAVVSPHLQIRFEQTVPVLKVPEVLEFEALRTWIRERLPEHAALLGGRSARLDLGSREIKLFDLRRLLHLLRQEFSLEITGLYVRPGAVHRFAERELKLKLFTEAEPALPPEEQVTEELVDGVDAGVIDEAVAVEPAAEAPAVVEAEAAPAPSPLDKVTLPHDLSPADVAAEAPAATPVPAQSRSEDGGRRTQSVHRTLRSGAVIRFDGDLYVFGDVNPGAHVVATGNIVVLGALKGMAHAGAAGDEDSFILAFDNRPTQLRIGRKIAIPPARKADTEFRPEIATVVDGQIAIEPYKGRLRP